MSFLSKPMTINQVLEVLMRLMNFGQEIKVIEMDKLVMPIKV